ncbi:hypothetical protein SRHO_G00035710 [Serrasalmus rhombeus]
MMAAARQLPFQHMPCVAHILQRSVTVCLDSCGFNDVLAKCRKIVGHFRHKGHLDQENEPLIQDVSTRWNSTLFMIRRLLKNKEAVKATLDKQRHKLVLLSAAEWTELEKLAAILEPCRHVTDLLGGETYVSCSACPTIPGPHYEGSNALSLYKAEQTISETDCPLQWWSAHAGAHPQLENQN